MCYEMVTDDGHGFAQFIDRCYFRHRITGKVDYKTQQKNSWLSFLYILLTIVRFSVLAFGPLLFLSTISGLVREEFPYSVELKEPLIKNVVIYCKDAGTNDPEHELKVASSQHFILHRLLTSAPTPIVFQEHRKTYLFPIFFL